MLDFIRATETAGQGAGTGTGTGIAAERAAYDAMCAAMRAPRPDAATVQDVDLGGVPCRVHGDLSVDPGGKVILYLHGGGYVLGGLDSHDDIAAELADACEVPVVVPDYRLAPEHRWPAQIEDVRAVWAALDRPGLVAGDSAGGHLAASLCLSRPERMPLGQVLIYPALGGDDTFVSRSEHAAAPLLRSADLAAYRVALFGEDEGPPSAKGQANRRPALSDGGLGGGPLGEQSRTTALSERAATILAPRAADTLPWESAAPMATGICAADTPAPLAKGGDLRVRRGSMRLSPETEDEETGEGLVPLAGALPEGGCDLQRRHSPQLSPPADGRAHPDPLAAPLHAPDLRGMPPAVIVTAEVDPLRDDGRSYAARLAAAGVPVIWRNEAQLPHGFLRARRSSDRARRSFQTIVAGCARLLAIP